MGTYKEEWVPKGCTYRVIPQEEFDTFPSEYTMVYFDEATKKFEFKKAETSPEIEFIPQPTELEKLAAKIDYISLMTGVDV